MVHQPPTTLRDVASAGVLLLGCLGMWLWPAMLGEGGFAPAIVTYFVVWILAMEIDLRGRGHAPSRGVS